MTARCCLLFVLITGGGKRNGCDDKKTRRAVFSVVSFLIVLRLFFHANKDDRDFIRLESFTNPPQK